VNRSGNDAAAPRESFLSFCNEDIHDISRDHIFHKEDLALFIAPYTPALICQSGDGDVLYYKKLPSSSSHVLSSEGFVYGRQK
jgi:hypothetical protein